LLPILPQRCITMGWTPNSSVFHTTTSSLHGREFRKDGLLIDLILLGQRSANADTTLHHRRINCCDIIRHVDIGGVESVLQHHRITIRVVHLGKYTSDYCLVEQKRQFVLAPLVWGETRCAILGKKGNSIITGRTNVCLSVDCDRVWPVKPWRAIEQNFFLNWPTCLRSCSTVLGVLHRTCAILLYIDLTVIQKGQDRLADIADIWETEELITTRTLRTQTFERAQNHQIYHDRLQRSYPAH
jgi:hypothetical protein